MNRVPRNPLLLLVLLLPAVVWAADGSWDLATNVSVQSRYFVQDARWPGQESQAAQLSVEATAELRWRSPDRNRRVSVIPFLRWDAQDRERSLADLREAYWALEGDAYELLIGTNTVFWGVTESAHLVDIINQTDAVADVAGDQKLGQPMVSLSAQRDWGQLTAYVLPYFRERTFAGSDGRFRTALPVDTSRPQYESAQEQRHVDLALRYSHFIGDIDLGLSLFRGTSREPRLLPGASGESLQPYYDQIGQFGVDLQYTRNAWLWKLETMIRDGHADTFAAAVGGFEYTMYQVRDSAADMGILLEYQYDGRGALEPVTIRDNDLFLGTRLTLNDTQDTTLLAGAGYDIETGEKLISIKLERRIGQDMVVQLRARVFAGAERDDLTYAFGADDYMQLQVSRFF
jgi:hypothetical protein